MLQLSMREGASVANYLIPVAAVVLITGLRVKTIGSGWGVPGRAELYAAI